MKIVRWLATVATWSATIAALAYFVVKPQQCNWLEGEIQRSTDHITRLPADQTIVVPIARQNVARLMTCMSCADDVNRAMVLAANLRFMDRGPEAIAVYRDALRYDRRPELYLNLGQTLLDLGDEEEGMRVLTTACLAAPNLVDYIPARHEQMYSIVNDYYLKLVANLKKRAAK